MQRKFSILLTVVLLACSGGKKEVMPGDVPDTLDGIDDMASDGAVDPDLGTDLTPEETVGPVDVTVPEDSGSDIELPPDIAPDLCVPDCEERQCGDDGCGGSCGECGGLLACSDAGQCVAPPCESSKDCPGDLICHKELGFCVECATDEDCLGDALCDPFFTCYLPVFCDSDKDCKDYDMVCDLEAGICVECIGHADCADEKYCDLKFCVPDVCVAGAVGCDGNAIAECNEVGNGWLYPVPCGQQQYCEGGTCHEQVCPPGEAYCEGDVRKLCDPLGKVLLEEEDCAGADLVCVGGECLDLVCAPGQDFCVDEGTLGHCDAEGLAFTDEACADGTYCKSGACVAWVCTPGEAVCADATTISTCNDFGSGPNAGTDDCSDEGLCCYAGECVEPSDELCDGVDNNCNGTTDEGCDDDNDGFCDADMIVLGQAPTCLDGPGDCDDENAAVFPGNQESPADGIDNDCDGSVDEVETCPGACTGNTVEAYLCALEMCLAPAVLEAVFSSPTNDNISTAWAAVAHFGNANNDLAPWAGDSYGLLATGPATGTAHSVDLPGGGGASDPYSSDGYTTHDNVEFRVKLQAPQSALGFSIDYIFMSVEYEEYIGSSFNDKFYIILSGPTTTSGQKVVINMTACSNPSGYWDDVDPVTGEKICYMAINTAFSEPCSSPQTNIAGTGYECGPGDSSHGSSTGWLTTSWPVAPGEVIEVIFHIHDTSDGIFDSEVILDNFQWLYVPFVPGTEQKVPGE